jgi:uncharacterized cofD-like protein
MRAGGPHCASWCIRSRDFRTNQNVSIPKKGGSPTPASSLRIVSIGGGTGLSTLLKGLKRFTQHRRLEPAETPLIEVTAVVTVTDDGGSSGRLRREFDVLPPGDIRNCMVALSEDEALLSQLFQYRFPAGRGLKGHSFGNLFLTALTNLTGDFAQAVKLSSEVLAISGKIYPSTADNVTLQAEMTDGSVVAGESKITAAKNSISRLTLTPKECRPVRETLEAIASADLITLGPGSLFTSVIPNMPVHGIPRAIEESPAVKAYFCNIMWQPGETTRFRASDHVKAIHAHARRKLIDYVILNNAPISEQVQRAYAREQAQPVENDVERLEKMGLSVIAGNLLAESPMVRHHSDRSAAIALELAMEGRRRRMKNALARLGS